MALARDDDDETPAHEALLATTAVRFAIACVSAFDWLVGLPSGFDGAVLRAAQAPPRSPIVAATAPFVGRLRKQYRMHPSLSCVPRAMFYFGEALLDASDRSKDEHCHVLLHQVESGQADREANEAEAEVIVRMLLGHAKATQTGGGLSSVLVITPYREQEALLRKAIEREESLRTPAIEVATLDRCQGREADLVIISLVRERASSFLDTPNRWNVALTRAREHLVIVGNVEAYLHEASAAETSAQRRDHGRPSTPRRISLLARLLQAYARQPARFQHVPRAREVRS